MLIFTEEAARRGINTMANHVPTTFSDTFDKYKQVLDVACHEALFKSKKRYSYICWIYFGCIFIVSWLDSES